MSTTMAPPPALSAPRPAGERDRSWSFAADADEAMPRFGWWIFAAILVAAALVRMFQFRGFGGLDDFAYAEIAHALSEGRLLAGVYDGPAVFPLRLGIIAPTALFFRAFGVSDWTLVAFPFLISMLSVPLAFAAARLFFGAAAGLVAAGIWALLPLDGFYASVLAPDLPAAFFLGVAVVATVAALRQTTAARWLLVATGLAAGLCLGVSWLAKETLAYAAPFFLVLAVLSLKRDGRGALPFWLGLAAGSVAVLFGEALLYRITAGDWLFHLHEMERNYQQNQNAFLLPGSSQVGDAGYLKAVIRRVVLDGPRFMLTNPQFGLVTLVGVVACAHGLVHRRRAVLLPALWLGTLLFMFNFASSSTRAYVPLVLFDRYIYPLALPAVVLVAGLFAWLFHRPHEGGARLRREQAFWGTAVALVLLLSFAVKHRENRAYRPDITAAPRLVSTMVQPTDRIYADALSLHGLEFYWSFPDRMNAVNIEGMAADAPPEPGAYVLVDQEYLAWLVEYAGWWPTTTDPVVWPSFITEPPAAWNEVWTSGSGATTLYRIP